MFNVVGRLELALAGSVSRPNGRCEKRRKVAGERQHNSKAGADCIIYLAVAGATIAPEERPEVCPLPCGLLSWALDCRKMGLAAETLAADIPGYRHGYEPSPAKIECPIRRCREIHQLEYS